MSPVTRVRNLTQQEIASQPHRCQQCGHVGTDVVQRERYVGGQGYVSVWECADNEACWKNWERKVA